MISISKYWQQFKDCVDSLPTPTGNEEYSRQINAAGNMINIGLGIEQLGLTEIRHVERKLHEQARLFAYETIYIADQQYRFYLPRISTKESLFFAIIYYQHLRDYEQVSYQGSINWFRQRVIDGVNQKKIPLKIQAKAQLEEIRRYCQSQNISIDELQLLRKKEELAKDYILRITTILSQDSPSDIEPKMPDPADGIDVLEKSLLDFNNKKNQLSIKITRFAEKLAEFNEAKTHYLLLHNEWQSKWPVTRFFYWLISCFFQVSLITNLKTAKERFVSAENELQQEIGLKTAESYNAGLQKQLEQISNQCTILEEQITHQQESKKQHDTQDDAEPCATSSTDSQPSSSSNLYIFFKDNFFNRKTVQVAAIATAAVVIQSFIYTG